MRPSGDGLHLDDGAQGLVLTGVQRDLRRGAVADEVLGRPVGQLLHWTQQTLTSTPFSVTGFIQVPYFRDYKALLFFQL